VSHEVKWASELEAGVSLAVWRVSKR